MFNKFKGLSSRLYVAFLLTAVLPVVFAGLVGLYYSLEVLKKETLHHLDQEVANKAGSMARFVEQLRADLLYLAGASATQELADAIGAADAREAAMARRNLEMDFALFARNYPHVYQVRYLDSGGREVVRAEINEAGVKVVPQNELQDKSDRYYVRDALKAKPGEVYISPMDLNVERGKVEYPEKPVVRFATPVTDRTGAVRGLVIVNLHAGFFLDQIQQLAQARGGTTYLLNRSGFYLVRSAEQAKQAQPFIVNPIGELTRALPPDILIRLLSGGHRTEEMGDWIIAYSPVTADAQLVEGRRLSTEWIVALTYPRHQLFAAVLNLYIFYGAMALSILVALVAGGFMSRYLLRPLSLLREETEAVAQGNFSHRVEIRGGDEIAGLGSSFNQMAAQLEQTYNSLENRKNLLEAEVAARTAALEQERRNLATIIENTADGILSIGLDGRIELANHAAARFFETPDERLTGRNIEEFWEGWTQMAGNGGLPPGAGRPETGIRFELKTPARLLVLNVTQVGAGGTPGGFIMVVRDATEERRLLDERRELDRQIFQMEKMTAMGELAMGLAHEIGNPLAGMKAVAQSLLEEEALTGSLRKNLDRIHREVDRLSAFLRTFHGFASPQENHPSACRLRDAIEDVFFWTRKEAQSKGVNLAFDQCEGNIPDLLADPNQLKQVLLNLVINAIHAMERGGNVTVGICAEKASVGEDGVSRVRFRVEDDGGGIPAEVLPRIFDPFFTTRPGGSGLGLAVVRKIVLQHGADIAVESAPGRGTRFELLWPAASE